MNVLAMLIASSLACVLLMFRRWTWPVAKRQKRRSSRALTRHKKIPAATMPRLVRQLASLLTAGRTGASLWQAMSHVLAMELHRTEAHEGTSGTADNAVNMALVLSVQRASDMGLSSAAAISSACREAPTTSRASKGGPQVMTPEQRGMWLDIAACFSVCEASGAPIAAVLRRLATTLEADHDAQAQRETALAGPRATVRLLTWLPALGMGLGMLMGVDPLGALFGSPVGWAVFLTGIGCAVGGRFWSAAMIRSAARPTTLPRRSRG